MIEDIFKPLPGLSLLEKQQGKHRWFHYTLTVVGSSSKSQLAASTPAFPREAEQKTILSSSPTLFASLWYEGLEGDGTGTSHS